MSRLFFSYSRADAEFVLRMAGDLRVAGIDLWLDQEDIPPGERWDRAVEDAMKSAPTLLVVLSRVSVASQNVLDEISYGLEAGKRIIPVLHQECDIPFRLRRLQYVDFTVSYEKALAQLVKAIRGRGQPEAVAAVAAVLAMASEPVSRTDPIVIASPAALPPMPHAPAPDEALREPPPPVDRTPTIVLGPSPIESRASPSGRRFM